MIRLIILLLGAQAAVSAVYGAVRLAVDSRGGASMLFDILQDGQSVLALDALAVIHLALEG